MKTRLGRQESQMLAYLQLRRQQTVRTGELTGPLGLTPAQERELFRRMLRGRLIARVRPGLFIVPQKLPFGGAWTPSETLALNALMADRGGRYQICGPNAFSRYGLDEQMPSRVYAYNTRISGMRTVGTVTLMLIKVAESRLGATEVVRDRDGEVLECNRAAERILGLNAAQIGDREPLPEGVRMVDENGQDVSLDAHPTARALRDGRARYPVGATLLYDSDPASEERETRMKATGFFRALAGDTPPATRPVFTPPPKLGIKLMLVDNDDCFIHTLSNYARQTG
ncbi:MAG TPA: hypothetical protein PKL08_12750, partial [Thermoanaerobaculaceae bacterium]|nr:hypothetical protein [Thermoanaerobaculaceae bacterium]